MILDAAGFGGALSGGRLVGLDVGTKTVGIATCDASWTYATPHSVLRRTKFTPDLALLVKLLDAERIVGVVVGLPLSMDGSDSPRTQSVRAFARAIDLPLGRPLLLWDERWSTQAVERQMIAEDWSRARRAESIDKHAAAHILQGAIDALTREVL
ncbi:Holliday junction resolvase RuvX [Glacieibacterium sp.]|uniref:Holliday junction resolvase RuvX n=1 Tax=Glacieibacterium sp. TaxID=2860237 RepID=UPI003AFF75F5